MTDFRPCILIPTFNNPATIRAVVSRIHQDVPEIPIIVIDDHSGPEGEREVKDLTQMGVIQSRRLPENRGKGAAVREGFTFAQGLGFTHALQIDADGQHAFEDIPRFLAVSQAHPDALVLGCPIFDHTAPKARLNGRKISIFWSTLETKFQKLIDDPLYGFRVYPIQASIEANSTTNRMAFDPEIAVQMAWNGVPMLNLPTRVRYLTAEEGGISHFRPILDNVKISLMHTRTVLTLMGRIIASLFGRTYPKMSRIELNENDPLRLPASIDTSPTALPSGNAPDGGSNALLQDKALPKNTDDGDAQ